MKSTAYNAGDVLACRVNGALELLTCAFDSAAGDEFVSVWEPGLGSPPYPIFKTRVALVMSADELLAKASKKTGNEHRIE